MMRRNTDPMLCRRRKLATAEEIERPHRGVEIRWVETFGTASTAIPIVIRRIAKGKDAEDPKPS